MTRLSAFRTPAIAMLFYCRHGFIPKHNQLSADMRNNPQYHEGRSSPRAEPQIARTKLNPIDLIYKELNMAKSRCDSDSARYWQSSIDIAEKAERDRKQLLKDETARTAERV